MSSSLFIQIKQHLFEIYPQMPRYAADSQQSQIIRIYDHIMLRFRGHYGNLPQYYIKSPLCALILGDENSYYNSSKLSICSNQNIIIGNYYLLCTAVSSNTTNKIRLNNYSSTLYGEIQLSTIIQQWKYKYTDSDLHNQQNIKNQQFNLIMTIFKAFVNINQIKQLKSGLDILVYKDFIEDQFMYSKQSFIYGIYTAIHVAVMKGLKLEDKTLNMAYMKIAQSNNNNINNPISNNINSNTLKPIPYILNGQFNKLTLVSNQHNNNKRTYLQFPQNYSLIIANSMTPLPKKLIKGKRFNLRQCEIQLGLQLIMSQVGITKQIRTMNELMQTMTCNLEQFQQSIDSIVPNRVMKTEEIQSMTEKAMIDMLKHIPYANNVIDQNAQYYPYRRLKFFIQQQKLLRQLQSSKQQNILQLIKQSSKSAMQLLQIGSEQLSLMISVVSKWTEYYKIIGNGWGGNLIIICKDQHIEKLYDGLVSEFYLHQSNKILLSDDIEMYVKVIGKPHTSLKVLNPEHQIWFG